MKISQLTLTLVLLLTTVGLGNQTILPDDMNGLVSTGVDLTLKQDYNQADSVFQIIVGKFPHHPLGYLYRAAVMQARSIDYLDPLDFAAFDSLLARAKTEAQKIVDTSPDSPLGYYYLGTAEGYDAYARVDAGNWLAGIVKGLSAASDFKKSVELDSSLYDAYVGVGTYYYWKSRKTDFLNWALGDRRADGIRLLEVAASKGDQNRFTALSALTAIYTDAHEYGKAIQCARQALNRYPDNRIFLWGLAAAQEQSDKFAGAAETYQRLLASILSATIPNPYDEILCRLNLVKAKLALKQTEGLETQIAAILAFEHYTFPDNLTSRAKDKFVQARNIQSQLVVK
jgi:tetratricopeptide (TPR) repeat protein